MLLGRRRKAVVAGIALLIFVSGSVAQERARIQPGPEGPVIIRNGVAIPFRGPGSRATPGPTPYSPPSQPASQPAVKPKEGEKSEGKKKPDSEKKDEGKDEEGEEKKPDRATMRPTEPSELPDPDVLKVRPNEEGKVRFSFEGHAWPDVLEWIADISEMSLDWQELPEGYLNLITRKYYTVDGARDLINRHLLARGYTMLIQDEVISVFKVDSINPGMVPRVAPEELADRQPYEFVKVSFPLDWLIATEAVQELKPMVSPIGRLTALQATNRIEAMDAVLNLRQIYEVLQEEQSDSGQDRLVREFNLNHTSAEEVVEYLNTLLGFKSNESTSRGPMTPQQMEAMKRQAQMQAEMAKNAAKGGARPSSAPKTDVYLLANTRKNSVVVNAPPDKMAVITQAIEILDVSSVAEESILANINRIQVYRLENTEPEALIKMIEQMGSMDHKTRLEVDEENNAIIASATLVDHVTIRTLVDRMDRGGRQSVIVPLEDLRAEMVVKQIDFLMGGADEEEESSESNRGGYNPFERSYSRSRSPRPPSREDKFRVSADVKNNALILWCNEFELRKVDDLLGQLRAMPDSGGGVFEVQVYRLNTLDPEPLVATLEDMDALGVHASLEADKESKSIVAYATPADHKKIQELIDRLDSSGRKFEVVQLRKLQADYVAGTIEFMMGAGEEKDNSSSRYGYYNPYSRGGGQEEEKSGFKIDADVESNRLLLLASRAEMDEVMNLLVKLGEIPSGESDPSTVRVIDTLPGPELERLLRRIEQTWPSVAPNPLLLPGSDGADKEEAKTAEPVPAGEPTGTRSSTVRIFPSEARIRFAQHETAREEPASEVPPAKAATEPAEEQTLDGQPAQRRDAAKKTGDISSNEDSKKPVSITVGPDGRMVIASEDTRALDRLEELLNTLAPRRPDFEIFRLKYAWAFSVALNLEEIFEDKEEENASRGRSSRFYDYGRGDNSKDDKVRLSNRRPLKFVADSDSNSILVQNADPAQLKVIGELIEFYDQPEPSDSQSIRKTEVVSVKFSKASVIAESVKEVYRDLLSANDKSLANGKEKNSPERSYTYVYDSTGLDDEKKAPSFKGMLSLGVDDLSNTLVVSAPAYFITDVLGVIERLDKAAEPATDTIEVVSLGEGVSASHLQQALMKILQQRSTGSNSGQSGKRPEQNQPGTNDPGSRGVRPR